MPKSLSLLFSVVAILFLSAMSISIAHSIVWVLIFGVLSIVTIGVGFVTKAKLRRKSEGHAQEE